MPDDRGDRRFMLPRKGIPRQGGNNPASRPICHCHVEHPRRAVDLNFINLSGTDLHGTHSHVTKIDARTFPKSPSLVMKARGGNATLRVAQETLSFLVGVDLTAMKSRGP